MAVKMGDVWDRTTAVLSGRGAMLAGIAALTVLLPALLRDAYVAYASRGTIAFALVGGLLTLAALVISIWGELAILAAASDPGIDRPAAQAQATARLLPTIGVGLVLLAAILIVALPLIVAIAGAGIDWAGIANGTAVMPDVAPGRAAFIGLYCVVLAAAGLFFSARLTLINPIVLHERRGARAITRSWALTRGHGWRILGVLILFLIVLLVAASAAQAVTGIVFRLILGQDAAATVGLIAGTAGAIVSTALTVVALAFIAQLYVALAPRQPAAA